MPTEIESLREVGIHLDGVYHRIDAVDDRLMRFMFLMFGSIVTNVGGIVAALVMGGA